jgi:hypothetical protein
VAWGARHGTQGIHGDEPRMMRIDELDLVVELIEIEPMTFHAMGRG